MNYEIKMKLNSNPKFLEYLRQNSNWYKVLNRDENMYDEFIRQMKIKYKLRTIDKIDNVVDSVDIITKILNIND